MSADNAYAVELKGLTFKRGEVGEQRTTLEQHAHVLARPGTGAGHA